ncbi:MAG TPA: hypothetical protein VE999_06685 [Gemmataceae bacterium]|nr:hypothetical protein [Bryobacteraceae bacterium]HZV04752.1 hypothetical protein [Gemmataceae bacterium]
MLNPAPISDAIASVLLSIPELNAAMGGRINAFHYRLGQEHRLAEAIYKMPAPSMLIAWEGSKGGNFDGQTIWKHRWGVYYRMGNAAGVADPVGYEDLWWITCNRPPGGRGPNIRYLQLYSGLDIMDTPSIDHELDEDLIDRFKGVFIIPEIGDN